MSDGIARRLAEALARLLVALAPPRMRSWAEAIRCEASAIGSGSEALKFVAAGGTGLLASFVKTAVKDAALRSPGKASPRAAAVVCAIAAVALGAAYLTIAGAPSSMILVHVAALALGLVAVAGLTLWPLERRGESAAMLVAGSMVLVTSLFGEASQGVSRWVAIGPLAVQTSLVLLPPMLLLFARKPTAHGTVAMALAALGLALQPDRAMAFAMVAGLVAAWVSRREGHVMWALATAGLAFLVTLARTDILPAAAFTDKVLVTSWHVSPLAGLAVLTGSLLLVLPCVVGPGTRRDGAIFGATWLAIICAAAVGNYPTPLVGHGGSAILGYLLSAGLLPGRVRAARRDRKEGEELRQRRRGLGLVLPVRLSRT